MKKEYDLIIYIGRFQPFHNAHKKTIDIAQDMASQVLVLVGSSETARSPKNPWTYAERRSMIMDSPYDTWSNIKVKGIKDHTYNNAQWIQEVGGVVTKFIDNNWSENDREKLKIGIIGHDKDHTSFYLNYFPQWKDIIVPAFPERGETIDATKIRNLMFKEDYHFIKGVVPLKVFDMIERFTHTSAYDNLKRWWDDIDVEKNKWAGSPYPPIFVTSDSVVVQSGHVLLIQRGGEQGYDLWAMPGGFINEYEFVRDASLRELREETKVKVPRIILDKAISDKDTEVFDNPTRSLRGRTITHTFLYVLDDTQKLPRVKGKDDAKDAQWISYADFEKMESEMFEDHFHIVKRMINKVGED